MHSIVAGNINTALCKGVTYLLEHGIEEDSRNGKALVAPGPVCTIYTRPRKRVLISPIRDANPFMHLMESIWMLAGRNDLAWPVYFVKRFADFSDDGVTLHGAYGHRWRKHFEFDQLTCIIAELRENPFSRRAVLAMWDPDVDLNRVGRDFPCNTHAYFDLRGGKLNMTVCNRSNDIIWGAYGANVVHFSILQEYMAAALRAELGVYRQVSNNYHAYLDKYPREELAKIAVDCHTWGSEVFEEFPLINTSCEIWDKDLKLFLEDPLAANNYADIFFNDVAAPMYRAFSDYKEKKSDGLFYIKDVEARDWRCAGEQWLKIRKK